MMRPGPPLLILILLLAASAMAREDSAVDRDRLVATARRALDEDPTARAHGTVRDALTRALTIDSSDRGDAFALVGRFRKRCLEHLDTENGLPFLRTLRDLHPQDDAYYGRATAELLAAAGRSSEAIRELEAILADEPGDVGAILSLADLHETAGDLDRATAVCEVETEGPGTADLLVRRGILTWRRDGDASATRALLARARETAARNDEGHRDRVFAHVDAIERFLDTHRRRQKTLRENDGRLNRTLTGIGAAWVLLLAGGFVVLKRSGWIV